MARPPAIEQAEDFRVVLNFQSIGLTDEQFERLCQDNQELRFEMSARRELIIMSPTKRKTGWRNARIATRLGVWTEQGGTGVAFDSSTLFTLPNGAKRSPNASWISKARWRQLSEEEREESPICPDFVIELRSESDRLKDLTEKMEEYIANGAKLGWLLDPIDRCAYIYQLDKPPQKLTNPSRISGDPILSGFELDFANIAGDPE